MKPSLMIFELHQRAKDPCNEWLRAYIKGLHCVAYKLCVICSRLPVCSDKLWHQCSLDTDSCRQSA